MGGLCNIMGCTEIVTRFYEVRVYDATEISTGKIDNQNELIYDYRTIWRAP